MFMGPLTIKLSAPSPLPLSHPPCFPHSPMQTMAKMRWFYSTMGYVIMIVGGSVTWSNKARRMVGISTTREEFVAAGKIDQEFFWMQTFLNMCMTKTTIHFLGVHLVMYDRQIIKIIQYSVHLIMRFVESSIKGDQNSCEMFTH